MRRGVRLVPFDPQVQRAQAAQDEEAIERPGHRTHRVLEEAQPLRDRVVRVTATPDDRVGVAGQVLRRRVEHDVGAERQRPLDGRRGERVVDHDQRPPAALGRAPLDGPAATAPMSTVLRSGFVGVSNQTSRVRSESASHRASVARGEVDELESTPPPGRRTRSR